MGRHKTDATKLRDFRVYARLNIAEYDRLLNAIESEKLTMSKVIRQALNKYFEELEQCKK